MKLLVLFLCLFYLGAILQASGQNFMVTGRVVNVSDQQPVPGVNIVVKGNGITGTVTNDAGAYAIFVPSGRDTLVFSHMGYTRVEESIANRTIINVDLVSDVVALNEVVVIGYGTQLKKDLTGALSSLSGKDFNNGNFTSPDQLIQGRVSGVQMTSNTGQPGGVITIKIRGNSALTGSGQPLFVVDGVPLSGSSARPNLDDGFGTSPQGNPLNFLSPSDIASIEVLKDASATAIYGARAAYGVIIINTKKPQTGEPRIEAGVSIGVASIFNKIEVLDTDQYRRAMSYYDVNPLNDKGGNSDGLSSILRKGVQQNYNIGVTGGNENGKYRISLNYLDQEGILLKSRLKKYSGSFSASMKFLETKKLGLDISVFPSQYLEGIPPLRSEGGIVGDALQWNPTDSLRKADGSLKFRPGINNPLAASELFNDGSKVTTILSSISPYYEFNDWLSIKMLFSINYGSGVRRTSTGQSLAPNSKGTAYIYNNENSTKHLTYTLNFQRDIFAGFNLNAVVGFEYMKFTSKGSSMGANGPDNGFGNFGLDYTNYIQYSDPVGRSLSSFVSPLSELQSYFGRSVFNYKSKYIVTATFRADGSTKFGANSKYGFFPSFAAAWNVAQEDFFMMDFINALKVRIGWGKTGNQEFPSGSSTALYSFSNNGGLGQVNNPNPNLKWQTDKQFNVGLDFTLLNSRLSGSVDFFRKITTDLLYPSNPIQPSPPGSVVTWINLDGRIQNSGLETSISGVIINSENVTWDLGINATFIKNNVSGLSSQILTGALSGPGTSGASVQIIKNGSPMNTFHTRKYLGMDEDSGMALYEDEGNTFFDVGNPNPTTTLGINTTFSVKQFSLTANMYGAFGHYLYNNTLNSSINVSNINVAKNIALSNFQSAVKESLANPVTPSSRFIEKGNYLKMSNVTLSYNLGTVSKAFKQTKVYLTGQNLFSITRYSGFDAEVNVDKSMNGIPSLGIDHLAYPSARTLIIGLNFSL